MLKKTVKFAGIGFLIGVVIGNFIAAMTCIDDPGVFIPVSNQTLALAGGSVPLAYVLQSLFSGIYGAICFGCMVFYEIERWPLALATGAHCAAIVLIYIPVGFLLGWLTGAVETLIVAGIQIVVFFIIWLIMWSVYKKQVRELNELNEMQTRKKNDVE